METISIGLTVYFEDGFWHGLFEQVYLETYQVCRVTFGQEPKDDEILEIDKLFEVEFDLNKENSNGLGLYIVSNLLNNYKIEYKALQNKDSFVFKIKLSS